ncbi:hypothetical protein [Holophaga foetida]|uniref:hypothetical protein n=1 Tax=Holophaga foetida TaxID=35839 RepID=UPI000247210A|nr:hypothetical protein [Holophaga foetida]
MSVNSVDSNSISSIGNLLLQQLLAEEGSSQSASGLSGVLGDVVSISSTAQELAQAPDSVTEAMADLFSGQEDVAGDITELTSYFQDNPQSLVNVLSSLKSGTSTYNASGILASSSDHKSLLSALLSAQSQNSLLDFLGDSGSGSSSSTLSLFG